jgi:CheY-like chemotaxis protein
MMPINLSSIKVRLILLSVVGLIGFSAILLGNLSFFDKSNDKLAQLQTVDLRTVQIANELQVGLTDLNRLFEAAVVEMDEDTLAEAGRVAASQRLQIKQLGSLNNRLREKTDRLLETFDLYVDENRRYADDVIAGRFEGDAMYGAFSSALAKREAYDQVLRAIGRNVNDEFNSTLQSLRESSQDITRQQFIFAALLFLIFALAVIWFIRVITHAIDNIIGVAGQIADGNLDVKVELGGAEEFQRLFGAMDVMRKRLKEQHEENEARQTRQSQLARLNEVLRGEKTVQALGDDLLRCLAEQLGTLVGAFYLYEHDELSLKSTYAFTHRKGLRNRFGLGESLVGQAALEQKLMVVEDLPPHYATVSSGLGESVPAHVLLAPLTFNGHLLGMVELMAFRPFSHDEIELVRRGSEGMAIALHSAISRVELSRALEQTQRQAEALERQQEELRATNEELEEQAAVLRASEENLQQQQEELRVMNEELEERNRLLDYQKDEIAKNNAALERSRRDLQEKAKQLELSGRYKSEFLSTMSHELRTPLNSILILSQGLMENKLQNLDAKQVEHARVIHSSGRDLLMLINDILDLSKVEEGKLELMPEEIPLQDLTERLHAQFDAQAGQKGVRFVVTIDPDMPAAIVADEQRLMQILRNFLSNAFKFTHAGQVELHIHAPRHDSVAAEDNIVFAVRDTGIGIPQDKQQLIFEAFQQVDGTISRKYGGTGLGLTISRKLAELMGGDIRVSSQGENQGSTFSLTLPRRSAAPQRPAATALPVVVPTPALMSESPAAPSARATVVQEKSVLIVEDDLEFSRILQSLAEEYGFSTACVHTAADAYAYLNEHLPASVILDLGLPDAPGQQLLAHLKSQSRTQHIPVHVISGNLSIRKIDLPGAREFIAKPFGRERLNQLFADISRELSPFANRGVLIIEDDPVQREQLQQSFQRQQIACDMAHCGEEALALLQQQRYGIIIQDLDLPDCDGIELLETIGKQKDELTHIIIYTARDISKKQDADLRRYADRIVLKTDQSITRLLNETTLFLHWLQRDGAEPAAAVAAQTQPDLQAGRHILLVDDDIRNLYSLSSVLEDAGLDVSTASTGVEALQTLEQNSAFDLILMDIMMPEMDGFEAMKRIRANPRFGKIPIIALTAKAMRDDRARCIEAGANDYLSKPVDAGKLKAIIKLWLQQ